MEFKELNQQYVTSTAECITEIISSFPFYNQEERNRDIDKFSADNLRRLVDDEYHCNMLAIHDTEVVGFLFGTVKSSKVLLITWIGMKEHHRRNGYMQTLWRMMEEWCNKHNISRVWIQNNQSNIPSISFVQSVGAEMCGSAMWNGQAYFYWEKLINGKPDGEL